MSGIGQGDLGILGKLAEALGIFDGSSPNTDWFANPDVYLKRILANAKQRAALLQFVDQALGGADNTTEQGVVWVPLVKVPDLPLTLAMTVDESRADGLHVGVGLKVATGDPASVSTLSVPLFCARKDGATSTGALVLLGSSRGRIKVGTQVTVSGPVVPGQARLGAIGVALELPTGPGADATFGFSLTGLQLPGATTPRDISVQAGSVDELDDALLELVLALVKAQADAAGAPAAVVALGGLLGLKGGDNVPDFPIAALASQGVHALAAWVQGIVQSSAARNDWLGHIGSLLGGTRVGAEVQFALGLPDLKLALSLPSSVSASGHTLLQPRVTLRYGNADVRVEVEADLMSIDLVTGQASALPRFAAHAASGRAGAPVLDVTPPAPAPAAHAETLRIGFAIDASRKLVFVLAADNVTLGSTIYPVLDLTSPDAVMDAVGNTVADVANELLGQLGGALTSVRQLLGLTPPAGIPAVTLPALMSDPVGAVAGYWQQLVADSAAAKTVLQTLRQALADASEAAAVIAGAGSAADPWRLALVGGLALEVVAAGAVLTVSLAASTSVDTLGQRCTVVGTRIAVQLARIDLAARSAQLMLGAEASLQARERGVSPPQARLELTDGTAVLTDEVGLRIGWTPTTGLRADASLPNARLVADGLTVPLALPVIGADGIVNLPPAGWDAVQVLVGHLAALVSRQSSFFTEIVATLGWEAPEFIAGGSLESEATLRLADLVDDAAGAIKAWLPKLLMSDLGPRALSVLADLLAGSGPLRAAVQGRGTPQDPYRIGADPDLPELVLWFPPAGLEPLLVAAPQALRDWRPGLPGLASEMLEASLRAEALAGDDVADLVAGRAETAIASGLDALVLRYAGGDGRIAPPVAEVPGIDVRRLGLAAGQLWPRLDIENATGRVPTTTVHVALGAPARAWPDAPAARVVDLSTEGLEASMFSLPTAAAGEWFVALGTRAACLLPSSSGDGTAEQATRLARWLAALAPLSSDIALVAVAGAGHAARIVADAQASVTDLVLLGTPLEPISLTTLQTQPAADALRLLHRLLPPLPTLEELADEPLDAALDLGHALVGALMELEPLADPGADLRPPAVPAPATRAGLAVTALFGSVSIEQAREALTAIVASGLAARARTRVAAANGAVQAPTGVRAGLRWQMPARAGGSLAIEARAELSLLAADLSAAGVVARERVLTVRVVVSDRAGWLAATPALSLRAVSLVLTLPLDGASVGSCGLTLHDAQVFGQRWERLRLGSVPGFAAVQPVLPEARVLLATLVQRLTADVGGPSSVALADVMEALGLIAEAGGVVADAVDQLVHDPGGLVRQRMALAGAELQAALAALLGPLAVDIDWATGSVAWQGGAADRGRFGWSADVHASPGGASGSVRIGPETALPGVGGLQLRLDLQPFHATLLWHHPGGGSDSATLWPNPDAQALARMLAKAAPALAAQVALEGLRRADDSARPLIDAVLDALGFLSGAAADAERSLRPLAGFLRDPLGWLGSGVSLAAQPVKIQALFDAMRPLMGLAGAAGTPLPLAPGVTLAATAEGGGARLALNVDPGAWSAADPGAARLAGGINAGLVLQPAQAPRVALGLNVGLAGAPSGRQAVHASVDSGGSLQVFLRPLAGADIPLVPFAGLGALSSAAAAALPYLLDRLAERPAPVGPLVAALGDAFLLRSGTPAAFSGTALQAWAVDPAGSLRNAATPMVAFGLQAIANAADAFVPSDIAITQAAGTIKVTRGAFALGYTPATHTASLACTALPVPGIETLTLNLAISDLGLRELSFTLGPAAINAGGVTIRPFVTVAAGDAPTGGARVLVGIAGSGGSSIAARWLFAPAGFALVGADGLPADAADVVAVLIDFAAAVALAQPKVDELLDSTVSGALTVRNLLRGVVLADVPAPDALIADLFVPAQIPERVRRLFKNLADGAVKVTIDDFTVAFMARPDSIGLQLGLASRLAIPLGDVTLFIENDDSWITSNPSGDGGLFVGFLDAAASAFAPRLVVNGLGLRLGKNSGPLIDVGLTIESVALHAYADIGPGGIDGGGVQLQFANLGVPTGSAGGDNGIAQGLMRDTGPTSPTPTFSPALAVQKHGNADVAVTLRAGDPPGPWWIAIQKGFGPLYLEQVGFDARMLANGKLERVSVLMDGSVSLFGLTCSVDDLQVTYFVADGDFLDASNWKIDLAGLAVAADMGGVSIAGGLLKQESTTPQGAKQIEYLGMLLGRFAVYGLTIYGGYGEGVDPQGNKFTAFFAIGAVNGPIGGPPAFFLTGIGGGFGINRLMRLPTDLSKFGDYPLIQALDIAASPSDPMTQLRALGSYFPMSKGTFWFAAGLSFNSFALVDGIAVVGVQIGDGLDINLLGLARMALPRPQVALVSIEVALVVRFSSSEGVLWVQGQLTDNSWLLYEDIKLTGGFAYVIWFKGERAGEFVLTMGGYHPDFRRAGYPEVPRLGLRWSIGSAITIKAGSYFALTSEALMAGGDFEASAKLGPAWAEVKFGAHGIVYFDPFSYSVSAYARIAAGVTLDLGFFGEVTFSINVGARIKVEGPDFRGRVTFEIGPLELTFAFGGSDKAGKVPIGADAFIDKYLERADSGGARAHALMTASGALPSKGEDSTPDGSSSRPFVVVVEFGLTFTSTVPAVLIRRGGSTGAQSRHDPSRALAVGPMGEGTIEPEIVLTWIQDGAARPFPFAVTPRPFSRFPVGVWGPAGDPNNRKVPKAEMVEALSELDLLCVANPTGGGPEIPYFQVEIGKRLPLPFAREPGEISAMRLSAKGIAALVAEPATVDAAFVGANTFLSRTASPTALASMRGERQAPPRLGTLAEGLESPTKTVAPKTMPAVPRKVYDHVVDAPKAIGLFAAATVDVTVAAKARTTVKDSAKAWRVAPPTLAAVTAERSRSVPARLIVVDAPAVANTASRRSAGTVIGAAEVPVTGVAHAPTAIVARSGAPLAAPLADFNAALAPASSGPRTRRARGGGAQLAAGECVVLKLPNAKADAAGAAERPQLAVAGAPARVVLIDVAGRPLADVRVGKDAANTDRDPRVRPPGTQCNVALGQGLGDEGTAQAARPGLAGWHAGLRMPYVGHGSAIGPGCIVKSTTDAIAGHAERAAAGWVSGAELARGITTVSTRFARAPRTVVVMVDDPAVTGRQIGARQLLLGLEGADRAIDAAGVERAPVLMTMDNRSLLAYEVVPDAASRVPVPVQVTVASDEGWSLVGVMASSDLDPQAALNLIAARGLQAALAPLAPRSVTAADGGGISRLDWIGPVRSPAQQRAARARASGIAPTPAPKALTRRN